MKKLTLAALALCCVAATVWAVPARRGVRTFTQSDGSTIAVQMLGDEFNHTCLTTDGLTVLRGDDGDFYYRMAEGITAMRAHEVSGRGADEAAFVLANAAELTTEALDREARRNAHRAPRRLSGPQVPNTGAPRIPVILVQYSDVKFKDADPKETFDDFFHLEGGVSAYQYFVDQSNGKFRPQFDVYGPYTLSGTRATYGGNNGRGNDKGVGKMVGQAVQGMNGEIDFSAYDNDGDGLCDVVIVLYAGVGEADSYESNSIWPCQWNLSSSDFGRNLTCDGVTVSKFAVFNELLGMDPSRIDGVGTVCHEFSHCLGLPDYYETTYGHGYFGMSDWSLMDHGCYADDGYTPVGYSAYDKNYLGWIDLVKPDENTRYTLPALNQKTEETDVALKLVNAADANECYVLENRQRQGWDTYLPGAGLIVNHVTYSESAWNSNTVNNYQPQRMTIIPADNSLSSNDQHNDPFPYGNVNALTNTTTPAARVNRGTYMNRPITDIVQNDDGTVSLWYMQAEPPFLNAPKLAGEAVDVTVDGFTVVWGAVEGALSYTIELLPGEQAIVPLRTVEGVTDTRYTFTGLDDNTAYAYRVKAVNDEVESKWSETATVTTEKIYTAALTATPEVIDLGEVIMGRTATASFDLSGEGLIGEVALTLADDSGVFALDAASLDAAAVAAGSQVSVTFTPHAMDVFAATVTISTPEARDITVALTGTGIHDPELATPVLDEPLEVTTTAFTARWTDESVAARVAGYNLHLLRTKWPVDPNAGALLNDEDWTSQRGVSWDLSNAGTGYSYDNGCVVLGAADALGSIASPQFDVTGNRLSLVVSAAPFSGAVPLVVELDDADGTVVASPVAQVAGDGFNNYVFEMDCTPGAYTVTLFNRAMGQRVKVASVKVFDGNAPEEYTYEPVDDDPLRERTVTGITGTSCRVAGLMAGATYQYEVQGVYTDGSVSEWSSAATVTLAGRQLQRGDVNGDGMVDVQDVTDLLDVVLGNRGADTLPGDCRVAGNVGIDVTDVTVLIDIVLGN